MHYEEQAGKIRRYVWHWHSYERVAAMYLNVLAERGSSELRDKIRQAVHTPPDGAKVPAMRPTDDLPWLSPAENHPNPVVTPEGEPTVVPRGRPVRRQHPPPKRYQHPEPVTTR